MDRRGLPGARSYLVALFLSLVIAAFLYWLGGESHTKGILCTLDTAFQIFYLFPYVIGLLLGDNAHQPSSVGIFVGLVVEWFVIITALIVAIALIRRRAK